MELQNTVKEALNALYHHPDDTIRMQADRWLQDFQRTIDAWQVLLSLSLSLSWSTFLAVLNRLCITFYQSRSILNRISGGAKNDC